MKYSTYTWDLVWALEAVSLVPCNTPATFIDSIRPNNPPEKSKLGNVINTVVNTKMFPDSDINKLQFHMQATVFELIFLISGFISFIVLFQFLVTIFTFLSDAFFLWSFFFLLMKCHSLLADYNCTRNWRHHTFSVFLNLTIHICTLKNNLINKIFQHFGVYQLDLFKINQKTSVIYSFRNNGHNICFFGIYFSPRNFKI